MSTQATPAPAPTPLPAVLMVSFDINQTGNRLMLTSLEGANFNYLRHGPDAGMLHFDFGDLFCVTVVAYAQQPPLPETPPAKPPQAPFTGFTVRGLALITVPHQGVEEWAPPSPFVGATSAVTEMAVASRFSPSTIPTLNLTGAPLPFWESHSVTSIPLPIEARSAGAARWELSLVLTVEISYSSGSTTRVFVLDPEAQVGNGTRETGG